MESVGAAHLSTETGIRNTLLAAAAEAFPRAFSKWSIQMAFLKAGLYPASTTPQLTNPCLTELPQTSAPSLKRTNVDISSELLDDIATIPARKAKTLKARQAKAAETRAKKRKAVAVTRAAEAMPFVDIPPPSPSAATAFAAFVATGNCDVAVAADSADVNQTVFNPAEDDFEAMEFAQEQGILSQVTQNLITKC